MISRQNNRSSRREGAVFARRRGRLPARRRFRSSAQPPCAWPRPSPEVGEEPPAPHLDSPEVGEEPRASPPQPSTRDAPVLLLPAPCAVPRRRWGRPCLAPRRPQPSTRAAPAPALVRPSPVHLALLERAVAAGRILLARALRCVLVM